MVISEKSMGAVSERAGPTDSTRQHTLGVHEVGDGNGVNAVRLGRLRVEDDVGARLRTSAEVLLTKSLNLRLDGSASLRKECQS